LEKKELIYNLVIGLQYQENQCIKI